MLSLTKNLLPGAAKAPLLITRTLVILSAMVATAANAGVNFYTTSNSFNSALGGLVFRGGENWSSATNTQIALVSDPLLPGVPKAPFPNGSSVAAGIQVQSNSLDGNPTNTAPGNGMAHAPAGYVGLSGNAQPSAQISGNLPGDSFDMIFLTNGASVVRAVAFTPTYYRGGVSNSANLTIRAYNQTNALIGVTTVSNVQDCLENAYIGIIATGGDVLKRVNIWAAATDATGADNILVYGTPAPSLRTLSWAAGNFTFELNGQSGFRYAIQAGTNLTSWQPVQTNLLTTNVTQLSVIGTNKFRFYRAQWLP